MCRSINYALGDAAAWPIQGLIRHFRPEMERRITERRASLIDRGRAEPDDGGSGMRPLSVFAAAMLGISLNAATAVQCQPYEDESTTAKIARKYADCLVQGHAQRARRFLVDDSAKPPIDGNCLVVANSGGGAVMTFRGDGYHYAVAEALLKHDYKDGPPSSFAMVPPLRHTAPPALDPATLPKRAKAAAEVRQRYETYRYAYAMGVIAECVARAKPAEAFALLKTSVDTPAEKTAIDALLPSLSVCVNGEGTFHLKRWVFRGSLAHTLYLLAFFAAPPKAWKDAENLMNKRAGAARNA